MSKRRLLLVIALVLAGLGGCGWWAYQALWEVPEFYERALAVEGPHVEAASDEMLERAAALASDVQHSGAWQAAFSAEQINGWLAIDLPKNHPELLPGAVRQPRVAISPDRFQLAARYDDGRRSLVLSLEVEAFVSPPDRLALRVRSIRAGALPVPLASVMDRVAEAVRRSGLPVEWREQDGDLVALVHVAETQSSGKRLVQLDSLKLEEGRITLVGHTERPDRGKLIPAEAETAQEASPESQKTQR